ncbi:hypothetical protein BA895_14290 [Humibacillus sp. DSM 29435]|uniref:ABC transporter ATP-binding protein n=1 Tax=Humibacillus sp. DSM 29435 TaxID=1869167 RepID=UPI0008721026|nr:ATP-binding cassette domain-containing protein [Humibacillus sp. DSM 29435]OFE17760.1 hypothetical protein BA895_14290 [Humibacillus sp. DSM 29435]
MGLSEAPHLVGSGVVVTGLSVGFRGTRRALDDVSFAVDGGVVGILGPNGAGKTTLLSVLATALRVPAGQAWVGGHDVGTPSGRRAARGLIGWLPQRFDLAGGMSVQDTVAYAAWSNGADPAQSFVLAQDALALVDLSDRARERVRRLSGGQRQRLGLAAAVAHRPPVLLLDEPSVGLDPQQRLRFRASIRAAASDRIVLLSSHLLEDVAQVCDRVAVMDRGRVLFLGSTAELAALGQSSDGGAGSTEATTPLEAGYLHALEGDTDQAPS